MNDQVRDTLQRLIKERGESYAGLSQLLGRNPAYVQQFVKRGSPRRLEEKDRQTLARYFNIDEAALGGPLKASRGPVVEVKMLSVQASAGHGMMVDREFMSGSCRFDKAWLSHICQARPEDLSIIKVSGDSMAPTLNDGDDVLVNEADATDRLRDGIYVLRRDDTLVVKRLAVGPASGLLSVLSDNPTYPAFRDCRLEDVAVLGRVVWVGRKIG